MKWWDAQFSVKPSDKDFNVLLKLTACGKSGCFTRRKFLKVVKLSDATRELETKKSLAKMKTKDGMKNMDQEEIMGSLAMMKKQQESKKRTCKRGSCEVKDKSGKTVDKKAVEAANKQRAAKAAKAKKEFEAKQEVAKKAGKKVVKLVCKTGKDETGNKVECSGMGVCTAGKSGKPRCLCDKGFTGIAC